MKLVPFFEIDGTRYEIKKTRWLITEYNKLRENSSVSEEDKALAMKATNLLADIKKYAEKTEECWEKLCTEPSEENQRNYLMFKGMSDTAIADYNAFVSTNKALSKATENSFAILEKLVIKALAEQYYDFNEGLAKQTWDKFADSLEGNDKVAEWLNAMAECLFVEESEEKNDFLSQKRKADMERENNRKAALRNKR